ncbi:MAG TPA: molybdopterin-guanine dinucleotide biosynthesis protein MobB, partial [Aliarcobacter cryaerophilus]|nr:molybdopterin-guanine dinucleotide biosynthesis protein MobB [Aliarcobacter cryaerophilus]
IDELISIFNDFDYLLVEGLKTLELPRISIFRNKLDDSYFEVSNALAIDDSINKKDIPKSLDILDLNDPLEIIKWIDKNAKRV